MKKVLAFLLTAALLLTTFSVTASAEYDGEIDGGYYIVFKGDNYQIHQRNRLHMALGRWVIHGITLSSSTPFKIACSADSQTATALYPAGEDNDYVPRYNSCYFTVEFTPDGNNGGDSADMGWYDGYVRAYPCEPPQEDSSEYVPVTEKETKQNLYEDAFKAAYPYWIEDFCDYQELYYHIDANGCDDWTLVWTPAKDSLDGGSYGVFDEIAVFASESYPFALGFGVFDVREQRFYSITQAWNKDFDDLHDVFVHIAPQYAYTRCLGEADGDGELTIIDATMIQRCLAGIKDLPNDEWVFKHHSCSFGTKMNYLTDYDCDGDRTILDVTQIQRHLVGLSLYPHDFTASAKLEKDGDTVKAVAKASFGEEPVMYRYTIEGGVHAYTVYGSDWGQFTFYDPDYEYVPGNEHLSTDWISDDTVGLPVTALTYNDSYTLTVTAKDVCGKVSQTAVLYFKNVY